jgi:hypothetical protein
MTIPSDFQRRLRKLPLNYFECPENTFDIVKRVKISTAKEPRQQRATLSEVEDFQIDDVSNLMCLQPKLAKHFNQILRWDDQLIYHPDDWERRA